MVLHFIEDNIVVSALEGELTRGVPDNPVFRDRDIFDVTMHF